MRYTKRAAVLGLIGVSLAVAGCGGSPSSDEDAAPPARVEKLKGTGVEAVVVSAEAAKRLAIRTALARSGGSGGAPIVIPSSAVLYDPHGETWTYTNPRPLVFVRKDISVERVQNGLAYLSRGPAPRTRVVTVGATELWGVEYGGIEED